MGREAATAEVARLLADHRLVTLTGVGGGGKTRLALRVAAGLADAFPHGAWLVDLAPLADPGLVPPAAAAVLRVRERPPRPLVSTLVDHLRTRALLVVLDNCEHLAAAAVELTQQLLSGCPRLRVLATSRRVLGLPGEAVYRVPPLAVPDTARTAAADVLGSEAGRLFVTRARLVQPAFALTAENAPDVARLCRRLDGIPLALELAAAWMGALSPADLAARLDDRFTLLGARSGAAPPRQETLRATLEWSCGLLPPRERRAFARLAVFAGWFDLDAAEAVVGAGAVESLGILVDQSLVVAEVGADGAVRYRLLETLRACARRRLGGRALPAAARRHCAYYLSLAEAGERGIRGSDQERWLVRLARQLDNIRAALSWPTGRTDGAAVEARLRLAGALWFFWYLRGHVTEAVGRLESLLAATPATPSAGRAKALHALGFLASARAPLEAALATWQEVGDRRGEADTLLALGVVLAVKEGDAAAARGHFAAALDLARELREPWVTAWALNFLAAMAAQLGDPTAARALFEESLATSRRAGDRQGMAYALHGLGDALNAARDPVRAAELYEQSLGLCRELGDRPNIATTLASLGTLQVLRGQHAAAHRCLVESLGVAQEVGELTDQMTGKAAVPRALLALAALALASGQVERAARLAAAARRHWPRGGVRHAPGEQAALERRLAALPRVLGASPYAAARAAGEATSWEQALADGLATAPAKAGPGWLGPARAGGGPARDVLTPRERQVAVLVARGLTNREIAAALVVTVATAESHVKHVLHKLDFASRAQIAAWAVQHGLVPGGAAPPV